MRGFVAHAPMARLSTPPALPRLRTLGVLAAAVLTLAACGGKTQPAAADKSPASAKSPAAPAESPRALRAEAELARANMDTATLARAQQRLAELKSSDPAVKRTRLRALTTLAVEARIRSEALDDETAGGQADTWATEAQTLVDDLGEQLDPGEQTAARARVALVRGEPVAAAHPAVLLPSFRDRELQLAVLSEPLWRDTEGAAAEPPSATERAAVLAALRATEAPTPMETMLLAVALHNEGEHESAADLATKILAGAPGQPLAKGLTEPEPEPAPAVAVAEPVPAPTPPPIAEPTPPPAAKPEPTPPPAAKPEPTPPPAAKPEPTPKPKPKPKPATSPKPKKPAVDLTKEGCRLVRGGDAKQGFAMLQRAFDQNPRDTKVTLCMAEGHLKLGRAESARAMAERVLRAAPKNKRALLLAGKIEHKLGNKRRAVDYYSQVLELDPQNATAKSYVDANG